MSCVIPASTPISGFQPSSRLELADVADVDLLVARPPVVPLHGNLAAEPALQHLDQIEQRQDLAGPAADIEGLSARSLSGARMAAS